MDIPRGHAMLPLNESDFLDFIYNYFKAEYAPIRSLWSTATAEPRQPQRWISMGHELVPLSFRPANAQAQKDLESLDYFTRKWGLDAGFVRGIVIRYAKYEVHERLEKKLYECCRLDLMVRKALKEKHLIDMLWPSPAPRDIAKELLAQGVQVRRWYGDMFAKYFRHLRAVDDFSLRPEVDQKIKSSNTLMLVPFIDHLVFGVVDPIMPIVSKGAGYANAKAWRQKQGDSFGEPEKFEVRFETPGDVQDTEIRRVMRQCQCAKCGSKRDVEVVISIDPSPGLRSQRTVQRKQSKEQPNISAPRRQHSKPAQRYAQGYSMPTTNEASTRESLPPRHEKQSTSQEVRSSSPQQKKNCPRCTFLNHPDLTSCEMCQSELPKTLVSSPPSPTQKKDSKPAHSHSASLPAPATRVDDVREAERPVMFNRHSLSSQLFSIFPFSQQHQTEHHAKLPPTQAVDTAPVGAISTAHPDIKVKSNDQDRPATPEEQQTTLSVQTPSAPSHADPPSTPPNAENNEPVLSSHPEMALMPLTPPPTSTSTHRPTPVGLPQSLMEDPVPVLSPFLQDDDEEDAGWGEVSKDEGRRNASDDEEDDEVGVREGLVDLDEVAREEIGVWGERED